MLILNSTILHLGSLIFCAVFSLILIINIVRNFPAIVQKHATISSYCAQPGSFGNRALLYLCCVSSTNLIYLVMETCPNITGTSTAWYFWLQFVGCMLLPLVGLFHTSGGGAIQKYDCGACLIPIKISETLHMIGIISFVVLSMVANLTMLFLRFHGPGWTALEAINIAVLVGFVITAIWHNNTRKEQAKAEARAVTARPEVARGVASLTAPQNATSSINDGQGEVAPLINASAQQLGAREAATQVAHNIEIAPDNLRYVTQPDDAPTRTSDISVSVTKHEREVSYPLRYDDEAGAFKATAQLLKPPFTYQFFATAADGNPTRLFIKDEHVDAPPNGPPAHGRAIFKLNPKGRPLPASAKFQFAFEFLLLLSVVGTTVALCVAQPGIVPQL